MCRRFSILALLCLIGNSAASSPADIPSVSVPSVTVSSGGSLSSSSDDYEALCEKVKCSVLERANKSIEDMRRSVVDEKTCLTAFGLKSDEVCNSALEDFSSNAPVAGESDAAGIYDRKLEELEAAIDAPLQVLYLRQLALLREQALTNYKSASKTSEASDYEAMINADAQFVAGAEESTRDGSDWDFAYERTYLQTVMNDLASASKKLTDVQVKAGQQQSTAMQYLQQQQQMIQQLQMQLYGQSSPWNVGVAYRIPDTNFNLQGAYQQGRTNIQVSCVPDEYASMLGPNGFTNGVGPGNLGLSLNLSL